MGIATSLHIKRISSIEDIVVCFFCLGCYFKQFYFLPSGSFQVGDLFFIFSFLFCFSVFGIRVKRIDFIFLLFVILSFVINGIVGITSHSELSCILPSIYFLYNFFIIISFRYLFKKSSNLIYFANTLCVAIFTQLLFFFIGIGRYDNGIRYMGTFNDPNQFGFYILLSASFLFLIQNKIKRKPLFTIALFIALFLIYESSSTGVFLGLSSIVVFSLLAYLYKIIPRSLFYILLGLFCIVIVILFCLLFYSDAFNISNMSENLFLSRLAGKMNKFSGDFVYFFVRDRNMTRILRFPQFFLLGSGEATKGAYGISFGETGDIHSDFFSILFSYGLFPSLILFFWVWKNVKGADIQSLAIFFGIIVESFTLVNHRQPLFWCLFVILSFSDFKQIRIEK